MIYDALFKRSYSLTIGPAGQPGFTYDNLKINFDIHKNSSDSSNKAKISLYNLNKESIVKFAKGSVIRLNAGYVGSTETLYFGDVLKATSERKGPDVVTTFECGEGYHQLTSLFFDKAYGKNTKVVDIITDLSKALNADGIDIGTVAGIKDQVLSGGFVCTGSVRRNLKLLLKGQGLEFSIQNNVLQIIPIGSHLGLDPILVSQDTGLIGYPSETTDLYKFNSLLNPHLMPGRVVLIKSTTVNGVFKIRTSHFQGDTNGPKWNVDCEADKIPFKELPPQNVGTDFITVSGVA